MIALLAKARTRTDCFLFGWSFGAAIGAGWRACRVAPPLFVACRFTRVGEVLVFRHIPSYSSR